MNEAQRTPFDSWTGNSGGDKFVLWLAYLIK